MIHEAMKTLGELSEVEQEAWHQVMLDHAFDHEDWERARTRLIGLLAQAGKIARESSMRSYLSCCAEAVSVSTPLPDLAEALEDFYLRCGMEDCMPAKGAINPDSGSSS